MRQIPHLGMVRDAYLHDTIDLDTFERLVDAALADEPTEIPVAIVRLYFAQEFQRQYTGPQRMMVLP